VSPDETIIAIPHPESLILIEEPETVLVVEEEVNVVTVTTVGLQGKPGEKGDPGEADIFYYSHDQMVPAAVWTVAHNLGTEPNVTVVDSTGRQVEGFVEYLDPDTVRLTFSSGFAGKAFFS
jgi:hypothetical protein